MHGRAFQDIMTIAQAALVLVSGLTNYYFWRSVTPKYNSELKMFNKKLIKRNKAKTKKDFMRK